MIALSEDVRGCLAQVGEALDDGLMLIDQQGVIHFSNRTARALLDLPGEHGTLDPSGPWGRELLELLGRLPSEGSATEVHLSGSLPLILEGYGVAEKGAFWGGVFIARMAGTRRREAGSTRAAEFAREVKNALHTLLLNVYMLRKWAASQPYVETQTLARFDMVSNEVHRLNGLAEDFLPDARPRVRRESVSLAPLLDEVVGMVTNQAREAGVAIRVRVPSELAAVQGDPRLLKDAFAALLGNRLQAMQPGGELEILAGAGDKHAFVMLSDNGSAAPLPFREEPYGARSGAAGRGVGIMEWVVRGHGGSLETFGAPGLGTTFVVKLPLAGAPPAALDDLGLLREA
jgi:nitrogen fixation/metabolism regulation signal transduction histidine kinase